MLKKSTIECAFKTDLAGFYTYPVAIPLRVSARYLNLYLLLCLRKIDVAIAEMSLDIIMKLAKSSTQNGG